MKYLKVIFLILFLLSTLFSFANIIFHDSQKPIEIGNAVLILEDKTNKMSVTDVLSSNQFKSSNEKNPNFGVSSSSFWIKIQIENISEENKLLLEIANPIIDEVELYTILPGGDYVVQKEGEYQIFSNRTYKHQNYIFDVNVPKNEIRTCLLKVKSGHQIQLPLTLGTAKSIFESIIIKDLLSGIYFGIILVMFFYNLFIYYTVHDKSYLFYVIYIIFIGLTQACLHGYTFKYLWPYSPWLAIHSIYLIPSLTGVAAIEFLKNFLQTKRYVPVLHKFSYVISVIYVISITLSLFKIYNMSYNIIDFNALLLSVYMFYVAYKITRQGYRPAKFFLFAWSLFLAGVVVFVLKSIDILPYNNFTNYILQIGSALEVVLLSFALGDRINILKKEKEESQLRTLETLKENERIVKEQNIVLETKVEERTSALQASNNHLKETQSQLVNAEKMASLGQLTAGIAHEINNPINFVTSNIKPLKRDVEDILLLLNKYSSIEGNGDVKEKLHEINQLKKELDTDYLVEEINSLLRGIDEGASRTAEIVNGLKKFSRLDEVGLKTINVHEGIEATLTLLSNRVKDKIKIIRDYGNLPDIECYPGKLNQLFMNILNNAIQAITAKDNIGNEGIISVQTLVQDDRILISIRDNGIGIPEKIKDKIFEPFFTTKDVGDGTGLGLSIVYSIITSHNGEIKVDSEVGIGTVFTIILPVIQPK